MILRKSKALDVMLANNPEPKVSTTIEYRMRKLWKSDQSPFQIKLICKNWYQFHYHSLFTISRYLFIRKETGMNFVKNIEDEPSAPFCCSNVDVVVDQWFN